MTTDELTRRAIEVGKQYDLTYAEEMDEWDQDIGPTDDGPTVARYMLIYLVDEEPNLLVSFVPTRSAIMEMVSDWMFSYKGIHAIHDLESDDYATPVNLNHQVVIDWPKD